MSDTASENDLFGDDGDDLPVSEPSFHDEEEVVKDFQEDLLIEQDDVPTRASVIALPSVPILPTDRNLATLRLPANVSLLDTPYTSDDYSITDSGTQQIRYRLKRDQRGEIIRDENGKPEYESNARIVRWSDGTSSLVINNTIYDLNPAQDHVHMFAPTDNTNSTAPHQLSGIVNWRLIPRKVASANDTLNDKSFKNVRAQRGVVLTTGPVGNSGPQIRVADKAHLARALAANSVTSKLTAKYLEVDDDDDVLKEAPDRSTLFGR